MFHTQCMNVCQIQLQPPFANQLRNYERKLRERGRSKGFLELVDRRITLLPRIDPRQLLISPSFSTLQFGKSFREFKAIFRFLSLSSPSFLLLFSNGKPNGTALSRILSNHDSLLKLSKCLMKIINNQWQSYDWLLRNKASKSIFQENKLFNLYFAGYTSKGKERFSGRQETHKVCWLECQWCKFKNFTFIYTLRFIIY